MATRALLIDEDTCATNFMIRDEKIMKLVSGDKEPITPFVKKIRPLYEEFGISTILVIGGSGDYFEVADHVIMMDCYRSHDVTSKAKAIAAENPSGPVGQLGGFGSTIPRHLVRSAMRTGGRVVARSDSAIQWGDLELDLSGLEQLATAGQTYDVAQWIFLLAEESMVAGVTPTKISEAITAISKRVDVA